MSEIEDLEDTMGVISELLELCKDQHNAAGDRLKDFDQRLKKLDSYLQHLETKAEHLQASVQLGVRSGVTESIDPAIKNGIERSLKDAPKLVEVALNPILQRLETAAAIAKQTTERAEATTKQTTEAAEKANAQLNRAVKALSWKMAVIACCVAIAVAMPLYLTIEWQLHELDGIKENIASQDTIKGQIKILTCDGKPCVKVDTANTYSKGKDVFILDGVKFK